jgi:hypothetical protein
MGKTSNPPPPEQGASASGVPPARGLLAQELELMRGVFGSGVNYKPVRLVRMAPLIASVNGRRAFVLGNDINLPPGTYEEALRGRRDGLLVHEMTHVWQFQRRGWRYMAEALWAQSFGGGYVYVKELRSGRAWRQLNLEQQAMLVQDAYQGSYFEQPGARFGVLGERPRVVRSGQQAPEGFVDYTGVLVRALEELRSPARP